MTDRFDSFVVLAEMRTGSNFFEANLNAIDGLTCYGEAFNPHFISHKDQSELLGVTLQEREHVPQRLLAEMRAQTAGMSGFRFFNNHDPRVLSHILSDPRCAKIVLTRNPLDSYVSLKIASETGQWKLTDVKHRKGAMVRFNTVEFEEHLNNLHQFQVRLLNTLQTSGQTAFYVAYDDIGDLDVLNGLAKWLGIDGRLETLDHTLKRQNPAPLSEKVLNYDAMVEALGRIDRYDLTRTPNFEPRRGPTVPGYVAAAQAPLLFMPMAGVQRPVIEAWLSALDGGADLLCSFSQKTLRQWKRRNPGHRSFTVVSHPLARAHHAFDALLTAKDEDARALRGALRRGYALPFPNSVEEIAQDQAAHRALFLAFLRFLKAHVAGQTSIRPHAAWASQSAVLSGFSVFQAPDMVVRAESLSDDLTWLAKRVGYDAAGPQPQSDALPVSLSQIYDEDVEKAARDAYQKDYMAFGYRAWGS